MARTEGFAGLHRRLSFASTWVAAVVLVLVAALLRRSGLAAGAQAAAFAVALATVVLFVLFVRRFVGAPVEDVERAVEAAARGEEAAGSPIAAEVSLMLKSRLRDLGAPAVAGSAGAPLEADEDGLRARALRSAQAREHSIASAIAAAPEIVLDEPSLRRHLLHRVLDAAGFDRGGVVLLVGKEWRPYETANLAAAPDAAAAAAVGALAAGLPADEPVRLAAGPDLAAWGAARLDARAAAGLVLRVEAGSGFVGAVAAFAPAGVEVGPGARALLAALGREAAVAIVALRVYDRVRHEHARSLEALSRVLEVRDPSGPGHGKRTAELASRVAARLGLADAERDAISIAAHIHDVGKVAISDMVLTKKGPLTPDERRLVEQHPALGVRLLRTLSLSDRLAEIVLRHHERWDGAGYPGGVKGEAIPVGARILAACEAFDAMVSGQPHQEAVGIREAIAEIGAGRGTQFDPAVADAILAETHGWEDLPSWLRE